MKRNPTPLSTMAALYSKGDSPVSENPMIQARAATSVNPLLLVPQSIEQLQFVAGIIARSDLAPKDYKGKPENVAVAIAMGMELGVSPMQAVQGIAVINGRPSVWGDLLLALCRAHPQCQGIDESLEYDNAGNVTAAICRAQRNGHQQERRFSVDDAKRAGLWTKDGPWKQYPNRMLQMRARGFCLRDVFADALRGLSCAEEQADFVVEAEPQRPAAVVAIAARSERAAYPPEEFEANLPKWRAAIEAGKKIAGDIVAMVETKGTLTTEQRNRILECTPPPAAAAGAETERAA